MKWTDLITHKYGSDWQTVPNIWSNEEFDKGFDIVWRSIPSWAESVPNTDKRFGLLEQTQVSRIPVDSMLESKLCTNLHSTSTTTNGFIYYNGGTTDKPEGVFFRAENVNVEPYVKFMNGSYEPTVGALAMEFRGNTYVGGVTSDKMINKWSPLLTPDSWTNGLLNDILYHTDDPNFTREQDEPVNPPLGGTFPYVQLDRSLNRNMFVLAKTTNQPFNVGIPYFSEYSKCMDYIQGKIGIEEADNYDELSNGFEYDIYVEGSDLPIFNIVWKNDFIKNGDPEVYKDWKFVLKATHSADPARTYTFTANFAQGKFSTTYRELLKKTDPDSYNAVVSGLLEYRNGFVVPFIGIEMYIDKGDNVKSDSLFPTFYNNSLNGLNAQGSLILAGIGYAGIGNQEIQFHTSPTTAHADVQGDANSVGYREEKGYGKGYNYNNSNFNILNIYARSYETYGEGEGSNVIVTKTQDGSFIMLYSGSGVEDEYKYPEDESETKIVADDELFTGILTNTYALTRQQVQLIGGKLWSDTFIKDIRLVNNNPIESIVSCMRFPYRVSKDYTSTSVYIGNIDMDVDGRENLKSTRVTLATFDFPAYYNSYLDFNPYSHFYLFLPFVGIKELDIEKYYNRKGIKIVYIVDYHTGNCVVAITLSDNTVMDLYSGTIGVSLQLSNSGLNELQRKYASALVNAGVDIAGTVASASMMSSKAAKTAVGVSGGTNTGGDLVNTMLTTQKHVTSTGSIDSTCMFNLSMQCYYIYELCAFQEPSLYNHTYGKPCNLTKRIGSLHGFTQISPDTDLSGLTATQAEIDELRGILSSGFFA